MKNTVKHIGKCAWCGTIDDLLSMDRGIFKRTMKSTNREVSDYAVGQSNYKAWKDEFKHLRVQLAKLPAAYRRLHIAFEYVLPGHPDPAGWLAAVKVQ